MRYLFILFFILCFNIFPGRAIQPSFVPGKVRLTSYLHFRYTFIENDAQNKVSDDHWSLRRFKIAGYWQIDQKVSFCAQAIYKTHNYSDTDDDVHLQHAYLRYLFFKSFKVKIGQFKPPFGWERFQSDFRLPTTERTQAIDRLIPNGSFGKSFVRDYGIQFFGNLTSTFQYEFALQSGSGANNGFSNRNFPLLTARLSYKTNLHVPILGKEVQLLSQVAYTCRQNKDNNFSKQLPGCNKAIFQNFSGQDRRMDVAVALTSSKTQFAAEFIAAEFLSDNAEMATVRAAGWFCQYSQFISDRWQYVLRYEHFDPNQSIKNLHDSSRLTLGVDFYFKNKLDRLMLNYVRNMEVAGESNNDEVIVQLQYFLFGNS